MWNTQQADLRAIRRDVEQMQNLLSRMAFDEAGWPMNQVEKQLAGQGRRVRASAEADLRQHSMAVNLLLTAAGLIIGAVVSAIFTSHHWFGT
jgi:hypothetical protein